jgi:hypothetical protein
VGCRAADQRPEDPKTSPNNRPSATATDSQYMPSVMIAKFREKVPEHPTTFGGGATTGIDSLLAHYVRGIERADTAAIRPLALTVSEFAWLYYLDSPMAQKPYELDPDVMWIQISSQSQKGFLRALDAYGGKSFGVWTRACDAPKAAGALRLHECAIGFHRSGDAPATLKLSVVERDGRFKLVGFGTSL